MVATRAVTENGSILFAKTSDRGVNEAQPLCFYPAKDHASAETVACTFIQIPQVKRTFACIGSRPYNIFGFEHGINEHGLIIGNEAVSGREPPERRWGLLGMDIVRLALERCRGAAEAVEMMGWLLETYGTGGDPAYRIPSFNANCIAADRAEAYLFESCQRHWVAKKVETVGYLSNCYSITDDYDRIGKNVRKELIEKGWAAPSASDPINAAAAFTKDDCVFAEAEGFLRYVRLSELMDARPPFTVKTMMQNLRDHYEGKQFDRLPYSPAAAKIPCICSHPGGMSGCASAAGVVAEIRGDAPEAIRFTYWGSMAPPCGSVFRPFYNVNWLPEDVQKAHALYDPASQWWVFTELERYLALDYENQIQRVRQSFDALEDRFLEESRALEAGFDGDTAALKAFSSRAAAESLALARAHLKRIQDGLSPRALDRLLLAYFTESAEACGMPYDAEKIQ
jgi:dipeptidase